MLVVLLALALVGTACRSGPAPASPLPAPPAEPALSTTESYSNTVKWSTASEVDNFGYDVYRGESPEGPFVRLTEKPIEGAFTSDVIHRYRFVDESIDPTKTYYYYVESISMSGDRERFTPVGEAKAKIPQDKENTENIGNGTAKGG